MTALAIAWLGHVQREKLTIGPTRPIIADTALTITPTHRRVTDRTKFRSYSRFQPIQCVPLFGDVRTLWWYKGLPLKRGLDRVPAHKAPR